MIKDIYDIDLSDKGFVIQQSSEHSLVGLAELSEFDKILRVTFLLGDKKENEHFMRFIVSNTNYDVYFSNNELGGFTKLDDWYFLNLKHK